MYEIPVFLLFVINMYLTFTKNDGDIFGSIMNNKILSMSLFCIIITIMILSMNIASLDDTDIDTADACIYMGVIIPGFFAIIYLILFASSYFRKKATTAGGASAVAPAAAPAAAPVAAPAAAPAAAAPAKTGGGRYRAGRKYKKSRTRSGK
jgi:hypothetical protein